MTDTPEPRARGRCVYIPSYDCRCDDPADCPIIKAPPGTYPLRKETTDG